MVFMSKYDEIKNQHRGEFIAIFDGDIVGDTSRKALVRKDPSEGRRQRY